MQSLIWSIVCVSHDGQMCVCYMLICFVSVICYSAICGCGLPCLPYVYLLCTCCLWTIFLSVICGCAQCQIMVYLHVLHGSVVYLL